MKISTPSHTNTSFCRHVPPSAEAGGLRCSELLLSFASRLTSVMDVSAEDVPGDCASEVLAEAATEASVVVGCLRLCSCWDPTLRLITVDGTRYWRRYAMLRGCLAANSSTRYPLLDRLLASSI